MNFKFQVKLQIILLAYSQTVVFKEIKEELEDCTILDVLQNIINSKTDFSYEYLNLKLVDVYSHNDTLNILYTGLVPYDFIEDKENWKKIGDTNDELLQKIVYECSLRATS